MLAATENIAVACSEAVLADVDFGKFQSTVPTLHVEIVTAANTFDNSLVTPELERFLAGWAG